MLGGGRDGVSYRWKGAVYLVMSALSTLHLQALDSQLAALVKMCARLSVPHYRSQVDVGAGGQGGSGREGAGGKQGATGPRLLINQTSTCARRQ